MKVRLFSVPWDSGHRDVRMGAGPLHLLELGLPERLEEDGHRVLRVDVEVGSPLLTETGVAFEVARRLAGEVKVARKADELPLVLAGNCVSALGTVAGLSPGTGVVWLDAHGDFNTPETSPSGFLDGMALAMVVGDCWSGSTSRIPGFTPVRPEEVLLVGARDLDPLEKARLERAEIARLSAAHLDDAGRVEEAVSTLAGVVDFVYLHLDLDVLDPGVARANPFATPGGASLEGVERLMARLIPALPLAALAVTAYAPEEDEDGRAARAAETLIRVALRKAAE